MKEVIRHSLLAAPQVGSILTQHAFNGYGQRTDERSNTLWPKGYEKQDPSIINGSCLVAVFHIIKTKEVSHARNN